jgi:hypothetical protein
MIDKVLGGVPIAPAESPATPQKSFEKVLKAPAKAPSPTTPGLQSPGSVTRAPVHPAPPTAAPRAASAIPRAAVRPAGAQIVGQIAESQRKLDRILKLAESGKTFSPAELLAFQAHAYSASQEVDLASKVVEKGTGAVKQTLQTQV